MLQILLSFDIYQVKSPEIEQCALHTTVYSGWLIKTEPRLAVHSEECKLTPTLTFDL